jgi:hypothetical protein
LLEGLAAEAWRRYEKGEMEDDEFYCSFAQMAGHEYRLKKFRKAKSA